MARTDQSGWWLLTRVSTARSGPCVKQQPRRLASIASRPPTHIIHLIGPVSSRSTFLEQAPAIVLRLAGPTGSAGQRQMRYQHGQVNEGQNAQAVKRERT